MIETIALTIAAVALIAGNMALSRDSLKAKKQQEKDREMKSRKEPENESLNTEVYSPYFFPVEERNEREKQLYQQGKEFSGRINGIEKTLEFMNKRQDIINRRITSIENKMRKIDLNGSMKKLEDTTYISRKMDKMDDFRRNTVIEIEAIKQSLREASKANLMLSKQLKSGKDEAIDRKIHGLVFHAKK